MLGAKGELEQDKNLSFKGLKTWIQTTHTDTHTLWLKELGKSRWHFEQSLKEQLSSFFPGRRNNMYKGMIIQKCIEKN